MFAGSIPFARIYSRMTFAGREKRGFSFISVQACVAVSNLNSPHFFTQSNMTEILGMSLGSSLAGIAAPGKVIYVLVLSGFL